MVQEVRAVHSNQSERASCFLDQSNTKQKQLSFVSRFFPRLPPVSRFPALATGYYVFSRACHTSRVFASRSDWFITLFASGLPRFITIISSIKQLYLLGPITPFNYSPFLCLQFVAVDAGSRISFGSESDKAPYDLPFGVRIAWHFPYIALPQSHSTDVTFCFF